MNSNNTSNSVSFTVDESPARLSLLKSISALRKLPGVRIFGTYSTLETRELLSLAQDLNASVLDSAHLLSDADKLFESIKVTCKLTEDAYRVNLKKIKTSERKIAQKLKTKVKDVPGGSGYSGSRIFAGEKIKTYKMPPVAELRSQINFTNATVTNLRAFMESEEDLAALEDVSLEKLHEMRGHDVTSHRKNPKSKYFTFFNQIENGQLSPTPEQQSELSEHDTRENVSPQAIPAPRLNTQPDSASNLLEQEHQLSPPLAPRSFEPTHSRRFSTSRSDDQDLFDFEFDSEEEDFQDSLVYQSSDQDRVLFRRETDSAMNPDDLGINLNLFTFSDPATKTLLISKLSEDPEIPLAEALKVPKAADHDCSDSTSCLPCNQNLHLSPLRRTDTFGNLPIL